MDNSLCQFTHNGKNYIALVRKLTERECFRLMGVDDLDIDKLTDGTIARTSLYQLAGNSIVVDVLYELFKRMFIEIEDEKYQLSLFDAPPKYNKENPLKVVTLCSGYDSQCLALERLKRDFPAFDYDLIAWSEFDPESKTPIERQPAVIAHNILFPQWADRNLGDMTKIDWEQMPDFDMLFYSVPCTDISQAGLQRGFTEGSGTRSSIIWNVRDAIRIKKPKYACLENVAAMVNKRFLPMFNLWKDEIEHLGYGNFFQLLNAKHYGIPQNRNRIFLISIRDDIRQYYNFPQPIQLKQTLSQTLEECVDTKYYLNPIKVDKFINDNIEMICKYIDDTDEPITLLPDHIQKWLEETIASDYECTNAS